jgi:hypothetical protein
MTSTSDASGPRAASDDVGCVVQDAAGPRRRRSHNTACGGWLPRVVPLTRATALQSRVAPLTLRFRQDTGFAI